VPLPATGCNGVLQISCLGWPGTTILWISASHLARITSIITGLQPGSTGAQHSKIYLGFVARKKKKTFTSLKEVGRVFFVEKED
jgi:hypothetical protein